MFFVHFAIKPTDVYFKSMVFIVILKYTWATLNMTDRDVILKYNKNVIILF